MQPREITIAAQKIAYFESEGKGQPVLFIHGNSMSGLCFQKQFASPLFEKYHLVALDLPGHGRSAPARDPQATYTLPGYAELVSGFVKTLGIDAAVVVGWSLGGHVLLEAMGRLQHALGYMILGTPPVGTPMAGNAFLPSPLIHLAFTRDLNAEEAVALTATFFKPHSQIPSFFHDDMQRTDGRARETLGKSIGEGTYTDEIEIVAKLTKPLAIVHGEKEQVVNLSYLKSLSIPTLWRDEIQIIPDASHTPQWEQPESFHRLLMEFVTDCHR